MKILMCAYSCEPGRGSEPGIGWNTVREVAKYHDVWVLTRPDESKDIIEAELAKHPVPNLHFIYFTLCFWQNSRQWGQFGAMQLHHYLWQLQAYFIGRRLHQEKDFDLIHHVTFAKYCSPSFLALLPIPFIWGPVTGGESTPDDFWQDFDRKAKLYEIGRYLFRWLGEIDPFVRLTARRSSTIQATTQETADRLTQMGVNNVEVSTAVGLSTKDIQSLSQCPFPIGSNVRFISIGRLLHWKGFHLGLKAFAKANPTNAEYYVVGDGPELENLQVLAKKLKIDDRVIFTGQLARSTTLEKLVDCHVLIHPSLHDSGGWVCLEAMAAGRPVICLDLGGPRELVSEDTGYKIPVTDLENTVNDLSAAILKMIDDPNQILAIGQTARKHVQEMYTWQAKGQRLNELYKKIIQPLAPGEVES